MGKIAEQKALEAYPYQRGLDSINDEFYDLNYQRREGYIKGYDQALQDMARDAEKLQYLSDELGYAYACGCKKTMQDFLEKAEKYLKYTLYCRVEIEVFGTLIPSIINRKEFIDNFKNYMRDESEN